MGIVAKPHETILRFHADNGPDTVRVGGKAVTLPKIGTVAMVEHLRSHGSIREVTINRTAGTLSRVTHNCRFLLPPGELLPITQHLGSPTASAISGIPS